MAAGDITKALAANVRARFGDYGSEAVTAANLYNWLDEAQLDIVMTAPDLGIRTQLTTKSWTSATTPALVAGTETYALPSDFLRERGLSFQASGGEVLWAMRRKQNDLGAMDKNTMGSPSRTDPFWWIWGANFTVELGATGMLLTDTVILYYVKKPATMTGSIDPEIGSEWYGLMQDLALVRCLEEQGEIGLSQYSMNWYRSRKQEYFARIGAPNTKPQEGLLADAFTR